MIRARVAFDVELSTDTSLGELEAIASEAYAALLNGDGVEAVTFVPIKLENSLVAGYAEPDTVEDLVG